ncbi:MAG: NAD(P)-binding domain-containing protein [Rhodothermales bacterium]|nr:NAD(P)-binding domain-containing protein [Rhodothermales bacterium]
MIRKPVGILGSGIVGRTLATGFADKGYSVMIGTRSPDRLEDWSKENPEVQVGSFEDVTRFGQILVVALKGTVAESVVRSISSELWSGKTVLDASNPIADKPPVNNVLHFFTGPGESLMEQLQLAAPDANFVKCFSSVPSIMMVDPNTDVKPTMFICGNHGAAKIEVRNILDQFGWDVADMGSCEAARAIEPLAMLACITGFATGNWNVAFKYIR